MDENPCHFKGEKLPVEQMNRDDADHFINKLNSSQPGLKSVFRGKRNGNTLAVGEVKPLFILVTN
jgi:hypothetical protein